MNVLDDMIESLKEVIYKTLQESLHQKKAEVGIAFSGGIDSSLLVQACKNINQKITLLTVAFDSSKDIELSVDVANELDLPIIYEIIDLEAMEQGLRRVLALIDFHRIVLLENCLGFYYLFKLASDNGIDTVLSANGMDELFCGYDLFRRQFTSNRAMMTELMKTVVVTAEKDKDEMKKLARQFGIQYMCSFLSHDFVDFAMNVPVGYKIRNKADKIRKHILRQVAMNIGVSQSTSLRPKKAFQYSSGIHRAIKKMAKKQGFTRKKVQDMGYRSELKVYINNLKKNDDNNEA